MLQWLPHTCKNKHTISSLCHCYDCMQTFKREKWNLRYLKALIDEAPVLPGLPLYISCFGIKFSWCWSKEATRHTSCISVFQATIQFFHCSCSAIYSFWCLISRIYDYPHHGFCTRIESCISSKNQPGSKSA